MQLISKMLTMQSQLRIFHWQSKTFAQHEAFGKAYESLDELVDDFIEVFQGTRGVVKTKGKFNLQLCNLTDCDPVELINEHIEFLSNDLTNLKDEMIAVLNKTKYLLRLT